MNTNLFVNLVFNMSWNSIEKWSDEQTKGANGLFIDQTAPVKMVDLQYPKVSPYFTRDDIISIAKQVKSQVSALAVKQGVYDASCIIVNIEGEPTSMHHIVNELTKAGITCVACCRTRSKEDNKLQFVKFRRF